MSAYDDAVAYLDAEVHPRCDYDIYSDMTDIVDEMEAENDKLRELVREAVAFLDDDDPCNDCGHDAECFAQNGLCVAYEGGCLMLGLLVNRARELGVEVDE